VIVLVLVLVLMLVLTLGSVVVVVVVVGSVVVVVVVVGSVVVGSVVVVAAVVVGAVAGVVRVIGVIVVGVSDDVPPVSSLTRPKMINAISTAPSAPKDTSATGLRYQGQRFSRRTLVAVVDVGGRLVVGVVRVVGRSVARHGH
jgi:hypothetical protein